MSTSTIVVTGAGGFIASHIVRALAGAGHSIIATYHQTGISSALVQECSDHLTPVRLSLERVGHEPACVSHLITHHPIDSIIHCAAMANLALAEREPELAQLVNVDATANLARFARERSARFISFSTDQVFDGNFSWYEECDAPRPINTYGRTKVQAEQTVRDIMPAGRGISLRVSLVYGTSPDGTRSASEGILQTLRAGDALRLFTDEFRTPTYVNDIARTVMMLLGLNDRETPDSWPEVLHVAGPDRVSRYEMGLQIAESFGYATDRIEPITHHDLDLGMPRPADLSLNTDRLRDMLSPGPPPLSMHDGIGDWKRSLDA